jgi:hypothetical protein
MKIYCFGVAVGVDSPRKNYKATMINSSQNDPFPSKNFQRAKTTHKICP